MPVTPGESRQRPKIYAAVPNYNMASELPRLLDSIINLGYEHIYIFDDGSIDSSKEVTASFGAKVTFIPAKQNAGVSVARNKILQAQQKGLVHYLDADCEVLDTDIINTIYKAFERHPNAGVIGLRVLNPDGSQYRFNTFPRLRTFGNRPTHLALIVAAVFGSNKLRDLFLMLFGNNWERWGTMADLRMAEVERQVEGVVECNMVVRLEDLAAVDGFCPDVRFHEIQDLGFKFDELGREIWYVPEGLVYKYDQVSVRPERRKEQRQAARHILRLKRQGWYKRHQNTLHVKNPGVE